MKKAVLYSFLACILVYSCKKETSKLPVTTKKTYEVKFNVSNFDQTLQSTGSRALGRYGSKTASVTSVANYLNLLYYYVYDSNGNIVHSLIQDSTATNFGNIADSLVSGTYTVVIAAGKQGLRYGKQPGQPETLPSWYIFYSPVANQAIWKDSFCTKFQLTVSGGNINQNVTLTRLVGQLEVKILDTIPASANTLRIAINQEYSNYYVSDGHEDGGAPLTIQATIPNSAKGKANFTINNIIGNTTAPFSVTITCYDASQKILGTARVDNTTCQKDTRTILSGKLFGSNNAFNVSLNPWNPNPINIPF